MKYIFKRSLFELMVMQLITMLGKVKAKTFYEKCRVGFIWVFFSSDTSWHRIFLKRKYN